MYGGPDDRHRADLEENEAMVRKMIKQLEKAGSNSGPNGMEIG